MGFVGLRRACDACKRKKAFERRLRDYHALPPEKKAVWIGRVKIGRVRRKQAAWLTYVAHVVDKPIEDVTEDDERYVIEIRKEMGR